MPMEITFRLVDSKHVEIINQDKVIGRIFTPGGSGGNVDHAIQICGVEGCADFWGCGPFVTKPPWENHPIHKKDILLSFSPDSVMMPVSDTYDERECPCCFNNPCTCEVKEARIDNTLCPYTVKRLSEVEKLRTLRELTK